MNEYDPRSATAIKEAYLKEDCKRWIAGNKYHQPIFPRDTPEHSNINLTESVCKINKTLALIAIDSLHYFHFAEGLGIDVLKKKNKTAVVILDAAVSFKVLFYLYVIYINVQFILARESICYARRF